jgi:cell division septation protein DedD
MEELKPRLILTKSNKSRFDIGKYIFFLTVFIIGFYFGYSYKSLDSDILSESKNKISKVTEKRFKKLDRDRLVKPQAVNPVIEKKNDIVENKINYEKTEKQETVLAKNSNDSEIKDVAFKQNVKKNLIIIDKKVQHYKNNSDVNDLNSNKQLQVYQNLDGSTSEDNTSYTLQIAAFETERKSNQVVQELSNKGYKVYSISVVNSHGDRWNLVRLGNFSTLNEAQKFSELLLNSEGINSNIEAIEKPKVTSSKKYY